MTKTEKKKVLNALKMIVLQVYGERTAPSVKYSEKNHKVANVLIEMDKLSLK